jgi:hypothetical protein
MKQIRGEVLLPLKKYFNQTRSVKAAKQEVGKRLREAATLLRRHQPETQMVLLEGGKEWDEVMVYPFGGKDIDILRREVAIPVSA